MILVLLSVYYSFVGLVERVCLKYISNVLRLYVQCVASIYPACCIYISSNEGICATRDVYFCLQGDLARCLGKCVFSIIICSLIAI